MTRITYSLVAMTYLLIRMSRMNPYKSLGYSWTPKLCRILAFLAVFDVSGYDVILSGFRLVLQVGLCCSLSCRDFCADRLPQTPSASTPPSAPVRNARRHNSGIIDGYIGIMEKVKSKEQSLRISIGG